jgi:hypothetical protein
VPRFSFMLDLVEIVFSKELLRCSFGDILNVGLNKWLFSIYEILISSVTLRCMVYSDYNN